MEIEAVDAELAKIAARARTEATDVGVRYPSLVTLNQANLTLNALATFGPLVAKKGYGPRKVERLLWLRDALIASGATREDARIEKKTLNKELLDVLAKGKSARFDGIAVLTSARDDLKEQESAEAAAAVNAVDAALEGTASSGDNANLLASQLDALVKALSLPLVAALVADSGGPEASAVGLAAAARLRAIDQQKQTPRGTPVETGRLDLIDGLIVAQCRAARKAGRAYAKGSGDTKAAKAFEMAALRSGTAARPGEPTTPIEPTVSAPA